MSFNKSHIKFEKRSKKMNFLFDLGMKKFKDKIQNPDKDFTQSIIQIMRSGIDENIKSQKNQDGTKWIGRRLRKPGGERYDLPPRFPMGKKTYKKRKDLEAKQDLKYWRSYLSHPLLNPSSNRIVNGLRYSTTALSQGVIEFKISPEEPFINIINSGGVSRNRKSRDGLTVQPKRQFVYLSNDVRDQIAKHYSEYVVDLLLGNR
jgi:hypothetical protein